MALPDFQSIMLPYLKMIEDSKEYHVREVITKLENYFKLTTEDLSILQPSNNKIRVFDNRSHWAKKYLMEAGLLDSTKKAHVKITEDGLKILKSGKTEIKIKDLKVYPKFQKFSTKDTSDENEEIIQEIEKSTLSPEDQIEVAIKTLKELLKKEILEKLHSIHHNYFEDLVIDVLIKMGYGGSDPAQGIKTSKTGDEGIDGIIFQDKLGLDVIYLQAKKWKDTSGVGRPDIQKFVGALAGKNAKKGIFLTTSKFSSEAKEYVKNLELKVILIDGEKLAELMIDNRVGVSLAKTYEHLKIDTDYFESDI